MADIADKADEVCQQYLEDALSRIEVPKPDDGSDYCEDCGDDIPEPRVRLGYSTCISCQEDRELRKTVGR